MNFLWYTKHKSNEKMETTMEIRDVGQRIARLRKEKGWSQMGLAEKLNVSDKTVSKWENGGMPGIDLFPKMAKLFNVSIDYLMTGKEENDSPNINVEAEGESVVVEQQKNATATQNTPDLNVNVPKDRICPKCNKLNHNPGTHCAYCYHEFVVEQEDDEPEEKVEILYDEATNKPICPKCNRINPYLDTYCVYCYHEFNRSTKKKTGASTNNRYFNRSNTKNYYSSNETVYQNSTVKSSEQVGCLAYFVAWLFPLAGLIWGIAKSSKALIITSVIFMILNFFVAMLLF